MPLLQMSTNNCKYKATEQADKHINLQHNNKNRQLRIQTLKTSDLTLPRSQSDALKTK